MNAANEDPDNNSISFEMPLRLPGQYYDKETGLHQNYFRDYDAGLGRYVESDPIGLRGGLNTYGYVGGHPLTFTDPQGLRAAGGVWNAIRNFLTREVGGGAGAGAELIDVPGGYQNGMQAGIKFGRDLCKTGSRDYVTACIEMCVKQFPRDGRPSFGGAPEISDCTAACQSEYVKCRLRSSSACPIPTAL